MRACSWRKKRPHTPVPGHWLALLPILFTEIVSRVASDLILSRSLGFLAGSWRTKEATWQPLGPAMQGPLQQRCPRLCSPSLLVRGSCHVWLLISFSGTNSICQKTWLFSSKHVKTHILLSVSYFGQAACLRAGIENCFQYVKERAFWK